MMEDLAQGSTLQPGHLESEAMTELIRQRQPNYFTYQDWLRLNELEIARGKEVGRPRLKFTRVEDMLAALGRRNGAGT
jgi:ferredoxin--NADP+ reductase